MKNELKKFRSISGVMSALFVLAITSCQKTDLSPMQNSSAFDYTSSRVSASQDTIPEILQVPDGNKLTWHAYATGVQIYQVQQSMTDPTVYTWVFIAPSATLYSDQAYTHEVGIHFVGPTWEATAGTLEGMSVVGTKLQGVTEDPTAIQWLLLQAVDSSSSFSKITYIQRLYTTGGLAPTTGADEEHVGQLDSIPYTARYYFYVAHDASS